VFWKQSLKSWIASWMQDGKKRLKAFAAADFSDAGALKKAIAHRKSIAKQYLREPGEEQLRVTQVDKTPSMWRGVHWDEANRRWIATWKEGASNKSKSFSTTLHGEAGALREAIAHRKAMTEEQSSSAEDEDIENTDEDKSSGDSEDASPVTEEKDSSSEESLTGPATGGYRPQPVSQPVIQEPEVNSYPYIANTFKISNCKISFFCDPREISGA
jgi:AP2 domain